MARRTTVTGSAETAKSPATRSRRGTMGPSTPAPEQGGMLAGAAQTFDGAAAPPRQPTPDQIRRRAYEIYMARGGRGGSPDADWLQAERELRART